ncbi:nitrogen fixation NifU-like protein [Entomoplasma freundtii]|uniref:FeS assembly protein n=1 Tax=Entomoplasma freundtii TaxID=74700 RepID=A0A2K8NRR7_9MOLU|nr:iron-sulfur cluster assembly scaffold protein [Entomoplasma freundtii]ATZ16530.1 FeS assembly protein [Entomoplasma freundtii]TDY58304.1 nitrogen fixation NifU-like protein [Entomoplasma freundtii]
MSKISDEAGRKLIIERFTSPRHHHKTWDETQKGKVEPLHSTTCADRLEVFYEVDSTNHFKNLAFGGSACAIATASADLLVEKLNGLTLSEAKTILKAYQKLITTGQFDETEENLLGDLIVFKNVHHQKNRQSCATLLSSFLLAKIDS